MKKFANNKKRQAGQAKRDPAFVPQDHLSAQTPDNPPSLRYGVISGVTVGVGR